MAQDDPARFGDKTIDILQGLYNGRSLVDLGPEELELLNQATIEFFTPARKKTAPKPKPPVQEDRDIPTVVDTPTVVDDHLDAFWWT